MADRSIVVTLKARVDDFTKGMKQAKDSVDDLTKADVKKQSDAFGGLASKAALAGAAVAVGIGAAVKSFADFDKTMSAAGAATDTTGSQLASLRQAAIDAGKATQFSATEAAQGVTELGKAGVGAADILGGGLKGALDLAAAGQIGVGEAAETAASAMTQFKLKGSDVPHIADLLAAGANNAQGSVHDLGAALSQVGLVAAGAGLSIEETTGGLAAFASAGLIGSDAGTSFKTMLQRLQNPSAEAAQTMKDLGINVYDANGNFVGLAGVAGQLQSKLGTLTQEQRNAALGTIFGSDAIRAATVLYEQGQGGIQGWIDKVNQQGAASSTAAKLMDNLAGDIETFSGSVETAFIQAGSGGNDALRSIVQGATGLVNTLGDIPGPVLIASTALGALALAGPKAFLTFRQYQSDIEAAGLSLDKISQKAPRVGSALSAAATGAKVLGVALIGASIASRAFDDNVEHLGVQQLTRDLSSGSNALSVLNSSLGVSAGSTGLYTSKVTDLGSTLRYAFNPSFIDQTDNALRSLFTVFGGENSAEITVASDRLKDVDAALAQLVQGGNGVQAASVMGQIQNAAAAQGISVDQLKAKFPQYAEALASVTNSSAPAKTATDALAQSQQDAAKTAEDAAKANDALLKSLSAYASLVLGARDAARGYEESIRNADAALKENGKTLDIHTEKGSANQRALDGIAESTLKLVSQTFQARDANTSLGDAVKTATDQVQAGRDAFIEHAVKMGQDRGAAATLADQLGLTTGNVERLSQTIEAVPDSKTTTLTAETKAANDSVADAQRKLDQYDKTHPDPVLSANTGGANSALDVTQGKINQYGATRPNPSLSADAGSANATVANAQNKLDIYDRTHPESVITARDLASGTIGNIQSLLAAIPSSKTTTITTNHVDTYATSNKPTSPNADGSIWMGGGVRKMAAGGYGRRQAMLSDQPILWAEAGPEAYIPIDNRPRSRDLLAETNRMMGNPLGVGAVTVQQTYMGPSAPAGPAVFNLYDSDGALIGSMRGVARQEAGRAQGMANVGRRQF